MPYQKVLEQAGYLVRHWKGQILLTFRDLEEKDVPDVLEDLNELIYRTSASHLVIDITGWKKVCCKILLGFYQVMGTLQINLQGNLYIVCESSEELKCFFELGSFRHVSDCLFQPSLDAVRRVLKSDVRTMPSMQSFFEELTDTG